MPEIFLSYNREDASVAKLFADAFAREGLEVWWDQALHSGDSYDEVTENALHSAGAVVVLWSPRSVVSRWVRAEATVADQNRTLMPVTIEACRRPVMFELKQTADLSHWRGKAEDPAWQAFVADIRRILVREAGERGVAGPQAAAARAMPGPLRRNVLILASLLLLVAAGLTYALVKSRGTDPASASQAEVAAGKVSVAVLPFRNLSADKDQEFFSDGMTEEITSALAKVPGLNVVARTSAFQFKGENRDMRAIGQALGASHLIEGSVRREGNALRITAQLVKADDGTELWSESYDRELKGVFALQEDIAKAIAGALRVPLGLKAGESLVANRTTDTDSYQDYLRAAALVRSRGRGQPEPGGPLSQASHLLEEVVARDPEFAPAWAMMALSYGLSPNYSSALFEGSVDELRRAGAEWRRKAESASERAIRLDPNGAVALAALCHVRRMEAKYAEAIDLCERALQVDPGFSDALQLYSALLAQLGRIDDSIEQRRRLQAIEPFNETYLRNTAEILWLGGFADESLAILKSLPAGRNTQAVKAEVLASLGRYREAADELRLSPGTDWPDLLQAEQLLRAAPARADLAGTAPIHGRLSFVYLHVGAPELALEFHEKIAEAGVFAVWNPVALWSSPYAPLRKTERFKALVRKMRLVEYWRERGWPDRCHPVGDSDFACS